MFCGLVIIWNSVTLARTCYLKADGRGEKSMNMHDSSEAEALLMRRDDLESSNAQYRDSILDTSTVKIELTNSDNY